VAENAILAPVARHWLKWWYGPHGTYSDYWQGLIEEDPTLSSIVVTVDLVFGGDRHVLLSQKPISTTSGKDGTVYSYTPVLDADLAIEWTAEIGDTSSKARSITIRFPTYMLNPASLISGGHHLAGVGEVSIQVPDGDYDHRFVVMRGDMLDGVNFGVDDGGWVELTISDPRETTDVAIPPWMVTLEKWPARPDSSEGYRYPIVIGGYTNVPAVCVNETVGQVAFLVCYGHGFRIENVRVDGISHAKVSPSYPWDQEETTDADGVAVTLVRFGAGALFETGSISESVNASVSDPDGITPTDLFDVIRYIVSGFSPLGTAGLDRRAFAVAQAKMGPTEVNVLINGSGASDSANVIEFIEQTLLTAFPQVSMVWGHGGYGPIIMDRREKVAIRYNLVYGAYPLIDRVTDVQETKKSDWINSFSIRYNYSILDDGYGSTIEVDRTNSIVCALSVEWGQSERVADPIESWFVYNDYLAYNTADWMVSHLALPSYYLEYTAYPVLLILLFLGDQVKLTDADIGWTDEIATIEKMTLQDGKVTVGLRVWAAYSHLGGGSVTRSAVASPETQEEDEEEN